MELYLFDFNEHGQLALDVCMDESGRDLVRASMARQQPDTDESLESTVLSW
jgi:hypothetical protein